VETIGPLIWAPAAVVTMPLGFFAGCGGHVDLDMASHGFERVAG